MSKTAVADALKISRQTLYDILNEKQPVTSGMAVRFSKLFDNGTVFWVNLQRNHELTRAGLYRVSRPLADRHGAPAPAHRLECDLIVRPEGSPVLAGAVSRRERHPIHGSWGKLYVHRL